MLSFGAGEKARLLELVDRGLMLPDLPPMGPELLSLGRQPIDQINIDALAAHFERESSLSARILRLANSPFYGQTRRIVSLKRALITVGLEESIHLINFYMLFNMFGGGAALDHFSLEDYWLHCWACGKAARQLGREGFPVKSQPDELYLAGLLHDIGKIILMRHLRDEFNECLEFAHENSVPLEQAEQTLLGVNHAVLGAYLLDKWKLPQSILSAIAHHHCPEEAQDEHVEIAALVEYADIVANQSGVGGAGNPIVQDLHESWLHIHRSGPSITESLEQRVTEDLFRMIWDKCSLLKASSEAEAEEPVDDPPADATAQKAPDERADGGAEAQATHEAPHRVPSSNILENVSDFIRDWF